MEQNAPEVLVVGTGSWGTALATMLARHRSVMLLCRSTAERDALISERRNLRFLPDVAFPDALQVVADPALACAASEVIVLVVPSQRMRENGRRLAPHLGPSHVVLSAAKGLEGSANLRMSEVLREVLGESRVAGVGALSGPNLAGEIAQGKPATSVVASTDEAALRTAVQALNTPQCRVYANSDIVGVELGGALKNIIAIGAGAADGLGAGHNAKAAFVTRGLAEIARLGVACGANPLTFAGLAGLGDLLATVSSSNSRNRHVGQELARGRAPDEIISALAPQVAEGIETTRSARRMAAEHSVEMPITEQTYQVLFEGKPVAAAIAELMRREPRAELDL